MFHRFDIIFEKKKSQDVGADIHAAKFVINTP
jgi:hypothetical protein